MTALVEYNEAAKTLAIYQLSQLVQLSQLSQLVQLVILSLSLKIDFFVLPLLFAEQA